MTVQKTRKLMNEISSYIRGIKDPVLTLVVQMPRHMKNDMYQVMTDEYLSFHRVEEGIIERAYENWTYYPYIDTFNVGESRVTFTTESPHPKILHDGEVIEVRTTDWIEPDDPLVVRFLDLIDQMVSTNYGNEEEARFEISYFLNDLKDRFE